LDRTDLLDTFLEGMNDYDDEEGQLALRPQETLQQATELVRVPFKLNTDQMRRLQEADEEVTEPAARTNRRLFDIGQHYPPD
jgi:hypothetical protein